MQTNFKPFKLPGLVMALAIVLIVSLAACSSPSTPTSSQTTAPTTNTLTQQSTPASTLPQTTPSTAQPTTNPLAQQPPITSSSTSIPFDRVNGTLTNVNGNILTLNTQQGSETVSVGSSTSIQKYVTGTLTDLQTGQFLTVTGTADASGNVAASSITISSNLNSRSTLPTGTFPSPNESTNLPGLGTTGTTSRYFSSGFGTVGTLAQINGNTLTLTTIQGQQTTVTVGSDTSIRTMMSGTMSDLQIGESMTIMGNLDASGNIDAVSITIGAQGVSPTTGMETTATATTPTLSATTSNTADSIGVYSDLDCTQPVTSIEWGTIEQGANSTQAVYLEDLGNQDATITVGTTGLGNGLSLTATPNPVSLTPGLTSTGVKPCWKVVLTLTVASNATSGDYNFTTDLSSLQIPGHITVTGP